MNWPQNTIIMKTLHTISLFLVLVAACTVLSSCSLLVASPIHHSRPHHHFDNHVAATNPMEYEKTYNAYFRIPAKGGVFEFECSTDQFFISKVLDSSMPMPIQHTHTNCHCASGSYEHFMTVNVSTYCGSFYTINCNNDEQNWTIQIDPFTTTSSEIKRRDVWVIMLKEGDDYDTELYSLHFIQSN